MTTKASPTSTAPAKKRWTDEEVSILERFYPSERAAVAKRLPGRTANAIATFASTLGIASKRGQPSLLRCAHCDRLLAHPGAKAMHERSCTSNVNPLSQPSGAPLSPSAIGSAPRGLASLSAPPSRTIPPKDDRNNATGLAGLPWVKMPRTAEGALSLARFCARSLETVNFTEQPELEAYLQSLHLHAMALAERLAARAAA